MRSVNGTAASSSDISRAAVTVLFVAALAGRFPLNRAGLDVAGIADVRVWGCGLAIGAAFLWRTSRTRGSGVRRWPPSAIWMCAIIFTIALSAFWAPPRARLPERLADLAALAVLVAVAVSVSAVNSTQAARWMLKLMLAAGVVYAVAGIAAGGGTQGRYSAFGGGPNVFVRVVGMGLIAAAVLALGAGPRRRWLLLSAVPLLATAAVLSGSRGGLLSLTAAVAMFVPAFAKGRLRPGHLIAATAGVVLLGVGAWEFAGRRAATVTERFGVEGWQLSDYSRRPELLARCWDIFAASPVTGGGMDAFWVRHGWAMGIGYPHNFVAAVASDAGIVGVAVMAAAVLAWWLDGRPWMRMAPERLGCATAAVFVALASLFSGDYYDTRFAWVLAIVAVNRSTFGRLPKPGVIRVGTPRPAKAAR